MRGQDLTVREGRVFLKALEGLRQVDVIIRRVDEDFCDPLELRDDSLLGVPGLMAAVRAGFRLDDVAESAPDEAFAARSPRAARYVGWPMLVVLSLSRAAA